MTIRYVTEICSSRPSVNTEHVPEHILLTTRVVKREECITVPELLIAIQEWTPKHFGGKCLGVDVLSDGTYVKVSPKALLNKPNGDGHVCLRVYVVERVGGTSQVSARD